jgi:hypothetical protein
VKNLNARLREGTILVSAPLRAERSWIDGHLPDLARTLLRRERNRDLGRDGTALEVARRVAARFEAPPPVERVAFEAGRTSVWGTYDPRTGEIRLSAALRHLPPAVLESVLAHELCHTRWRTHGRRFRALLRSVDGRAEWSRGFLDGALWFARHGGGIPSTDLGPLRGEEDRAAAGDAPFPPAGDGGTIAP